MAPDTPSKPPTDDAGDLKAFYIVRTRLGELTVYAGDFEPKDLPVRLQKARAKGSLDFTDGAVFIEDLSSIKVFPVSLLLTLAERGIAIQDGWQLLAYFHEWARKNKVQLVIGDDLGADLDLDDDDEEPEDEPEGPAAIREVGGRYRAKP